MFNDGSVMRHAVTLKLKRKKDWVHGNVLESFLYECSYKEKLYALSNFTEKIVYW